jgi:hypothetical protein
LHGCGRAKKAVKTILNHHPSGAKVPLGEITKPMKGKFIIINLTTLEVFKEINGLIKYFDTEQEAGETCGFEELENCWVVELKYFHVEPQGLEKTVTLQHPKGGDGITLHDGDRVYSYDFDGSRCYGTLQYNADYLDVSEWYIAYQVRRRLRRT